MGMRQITFAIGGSVVALVMVIGMFSIAADSTTPTASTLGLYGHYAIVVSDPDGNIKAYVQSDNAPTHLLKDCLFDGYLLSQGENEVAAFDCDASSVELAVGDGGEGTHDDDSVDLFNRYTSSGNGSASLQSGLSSVGGGDETTAIYSHDTPITILQSDLDPSTTGSAGDGTCQDLDADGAEECLIDETGLFDANGRLLSSTDFTQVVVNNGDTVDITLTITLT